MASESEDEFWSACSDVSSDDESGLPRAVSSHVADKHAAAARAGGQDMSQAAVSAQDGPVANHHHVAVSPHNPRVDVDGVDDESDEDTKALSEAVLTGCITKRGSELTLDLIDTMVHEEETEAELETQPTSISTNQPQKQAFKDVDESPMEETIQETQTQKTSVPKGDLTPIAPPRRKRKSERKAQPEPDNSGGKDAKERKKPERPPPPKVATSPIKPPRTSFRSVSLLSDQQILESVQVKDLDTGEVMTLADAEKLSAHLSPLTIHLIQRTNQMPGVLSNSDGEDRGPDELSASSESTRKATSKVKNLLRKARDRAREATEKARRRFAERPISAASDDLDDDLYKVSCHVKDRLRAFQRVKLLQSIEQAGQGAIWAARFSSNGDLLATAGQDRLIKIWVKSSRRDHYHRMLLEQSRDSDYKTKTVHPVRAEDLLHAYPLLELRGHTADVLDICWSPSKNNTVLLSSSMDMTVKLWHLLRNTPLATFAHEDFVTAIAFHPKNELYFMSGSLDGKIRLWHIPQKRVILSNEFVGGVSNLVTAAAFCKGGQYIVAGTYDGRCIFFNTTAKLKYHTQTQLRPGKKGCKISGITTSPDGNYILVSSNDSRLRLFNLSDHSLTCKFKGLANNSSQICATFSDCGKYILSGSEDHRIFVWETSRDPPTHPTKRWRRDKNEEYYAYAGEHHAIVTTAIVYSMNDIDASRRTQFQPIVSCDFEGKLCIFQPLQA